MVRVLIADDDPDTRSFLRRIIQRTTHVSQVVFAHDGSEALEMLLQRPFELAILDDEMPHITGSEVLRIIKRKGNSTNIVLLAEWATVEAARQAARDGAQDFLEKPIIIAEITRTIRHFLKVVKVSEKNQKDRGS